MWAGGLPVIVEQLVCTCADKQGLDVTVEIFGFGNTDLLGFGYELDFKFFVHCCNSVLPFVSP